MRPVRSPVYVILNHPTGAGRSAWSVGEAALEGGAGMLQFRTKSDLSGEELEALRALVRQAGEADVPFLVNDSVDLALKVGAAGVHVGQSDAPVEAASRALGEAAIIGVTAPTVELALQAEREGVSYVAVGAMYPSPTEPSKIVRGPRLLRAVAEAASTPVCAIGGITVERVPELLAAGAALLAVISAVAAAPDPTEAVRQLVAACDEDHH